MSRHAKPGEYLTPIKSDDTEATRTGARGYYSLGVATYYIDVGDLSAPIVSLHLQWDAALIGVITLWGCNAADTESSLVSSTSGDWIQEDPSTAYVPITGTGASVTNLTITLAGGSIGGCTINLSDFAHARGRLRVVISTAGVLRCARNAKR